MPIELPEDIDEKFVNYLFDISLPEISKKRIENIDFLGSTLFYQTKIPGNFVCKLIAGRYYQSIDELTNVIICFSKASKSALELSFFETSSRCCNKVINLGQIVLNESHLNNDQIKIVKDGIEYSKERIEQIKRITEKPIIQKKYRLDYKTRKMLKEIFKLQ